MKKLLTIISLLFLFPNIAIAAPSKQNNKYGISLLQPTQEEIKQAADLVNSQGGDYGYVTLVIQENDRDRGRWQAIFDELRKRHLIPIVRIATSPEGENWRRPTKEDAQGWVSFLDSLNWVIKQRYVVLFNEPNHAAEWGGEVDPKSYGETVEEFAKKLHEKNKDYFVMLAGFDASAPHDPSTYEDEEIFLRAVLRLKPEILSNIDGWASHSYPNPAFSGSPWDTGRKSIRGYEWELALLKELGNTKDFPVFITETGWIDARLSRQTIADYYKQAYEQVWGTDERVHAVTPFVFSYQSQPFTGFSWKRQNGEGFYPQYGQVLGIAKVAGVVEQKESGAIIGSLPEKFVSSSEYHATLKLRNTGQAIWDKENGHKLLVISDREAPFEYFFSDINNLEPNKETDVSLYFKTNKTEGRRMGKIVLRKNSETILESKPWRFEILPHPKIDFEASLFPKLISNSKDMEIQIYDEKEGLVYKKSGIRIEGGRGTVDEVRNIVIGKRYRIVALKPYYLPRQTHITFKKGSNRVVFKPLLPLDFNNDGRLGWDDWEAMLKNPRALLARLSL